MEKEDEEEEDEEKEDKDEEDIEDINYDNILFFFFNFSLHQDSPEEWKQPLGLERKSVYLTNQTSARHPGLFLQHFTNSINNALRKQTRARTRTFSAHELIALSNPAVYNTCLSNKRRWRSSDYQRTLPPIRDISCLRRINILSSRNTSNLSSKNSVPKKHENKPLGCVVKTEVQCQLKLPKVMEITDQLGNDWEIIQGCKSKNEKGIHKMNKVIDFKKKNTDEKGQSQSSLNERLSSSPPDVRSTIQKQETVSTDNKINQTNKHNLQLNKQLDNNEVIETATHVDKKTVMLKYQMLVRTGKISYTEYLQIMSEIAHKFRFYHPNERRGIPIISEQTSNGSRVPVTIEEKSSNIDKIRISNTIPPETNGICSNNILPSEETNGTCSSNTIPPETNGTCSSNTIPPETNGTCSSNTIPPKTNGISSSNILKPLEKDGICSSNTLPPELERLYSRPFITTKNLSLVDKLPADFLQKDRDQIRSIYPMFDFILEKEKRHNVHKHKVLTNKTHRVELCPPLKYSTFKQFKLPLSSDNTKLKQKVNTKHATMKNKIVHQENNVESKNKVRLPEETLVKNTQCCKVCPLADNQRKTRQNSAITMSDQKDMLPKIIQREKAVVVTDRILSRPSRDADDGQQVKTVENDKKRVTWNAEVGLRFDSSLSFAVPNPPPVTLDYCSNHSIDEISGQDNFSVKDIDTGHNYDSAVDLVLFPHLQPSVKTLELSPCRRYNGDQHALATSANHAVSHKVNDVKTTKCSSIKTEIPNKPMMSTQYVVFVSPLKL
ncbi:uncharacterized protein [Antedon mediterranea]|uniref:uncharacterized protein n=1 Tax=Antedon mediterranea TaxID=105859 RepID=UPI003AF5E225